MKGHFALREWGFEEVKESLDKMVSSIVKRLVDKTKKPVLRYMIRDEIQEMRGIINENSVNMAISLNDKIVEIKHGVYVSSDN